jgi:hypothetical protein
MENNRNTILILLVCSVISLILGPVVILMGALSANSFFIGAALLIIGGLGLYAGMKALDSGD